MNEIIIGINWKQNSTASLMINGEIKGCVNEERFSRIKNDERYPINVINWLLDKNNINKNEIKAIRFV